MKEIIFLDETRHNMHLSRADIYYYDTTDGRYDFTVDGDFIRTVYPQAMYRKSTMDLVENFNDYTVVWQFTVGWASWGVSPDGENLIFTRTSQYSEAEGVNNVEKGSYLVAIDPSNSFDKFYFYYGQSDDTFAFGTRYSAQTGKVSVARAGVQRSGSDYTWVSGSPIELNYKEMRPTHNGNYFFVKQQDDKVHWIKFNDSEVFSGLEISHEVPGATSIDRIHAVSTGDWDILVLHDTGTGTALGHLSEGAGYKPLATITDLTLPSTSENFVFSYNINSNVRNILIANKDRVYIITVDTTYTLLDMHSFVLPNSSLLMGGFQVQNLQLSDPNVLPKTYRLYTLVDATGGSKVVMHGFDLTKTPAHVTSDITPVLPVDNKKIHMMITGTNSYTFNYVEADTGAQKLSSYAIG